MTAEMNTILQSAIGILGGTFDPIHAGHLRLAIELKQNLDLSRVILVPCHRPPHRQEPQASPKQRLSMVKAAIRDEAFLEVSDLEIRRGGTSYMIDTLEMLRAQFPNQALCLLLGIDAFLGFAGWHRYQDILNLAHLVIAHRPRFQLPTRGLIASLLKKHGTTQFQDLHSHLNGFIYSSPMTPLEISATDIRKQISLGRNPKFLLPDRVLNYIHMHHIYRID